MTYVDPIIVSEHVRRRTETIDQRLARLGKQAVDGAGSTSEARAVFRRLVSTDEKSLTLLWHLFNGVTDAVIDDYLSKFAEPKPAVCQILPKGQASRANDSGSAKPHQATRQDLSAAAQSAGRCLLRTFLVNGRPLGDVTAKEATEWADSRSRDARFVMVLVDRAPTPDAILGELWTEDEVETVYESVE